MTKLPRTKEELIQDQEQHPDRGMIGASSVVTEGSIEFKTTIPVELYNPVLLTAVGNGFTSKSSIATVAIALFLADANVAQGLLPDVILPVFDRTPETSRDFRAIIPRSLYNALQYAALEVGITVSSAGHYALHIFVSNPSYQSNYEKFIADWMNRGGVSKEDVESAIFGYWKKIARKKRMNLLSEGSPEAQERKLT